MTTTSKIALGVGIASGVLLTAYLLTGNRKEKTKQFIAEKAEILKNTLKTTETRFDDSEVYYI